MLLSQQHVACHFKAQKSTPGKGVLVTVVADDSLSPGRWDLYYIRGMSEILLFVRGIFRKIFPAKNFSALSARNSRKSDRRKAARRAEHWHRSG